MPVTGRLGTENSQLGNVVLGLEETASQNLQMRANILAVPSQTLQMRANIRGVTSQSLQMRAYIRGRVDLQMRARIVASPQQNLDMRANIVAVQNQNLQMRAFILGHEQTLQMRAHIRGRSDLTMRARILQAVEADLTVTFDAVQPLDQWLIVRYNVGDKEPNYKSIQMRARIVQTVTADLTVRFEVDYNGMPTDCISRPRTRVYLRTVRQLQMRARIVH